MSDVDSPKILTTHLKVSLTPSPRTEPGSAILKMTFLNFPKSNCAPYARTTSTGLPN